MTVRAHRHLKWPAFDYLERGLMVLCALLLLGFTVCEVADVLFRNLGRPWLNANEFAGGLFTWGVFLGMGVAVPPDQHCRPAAGARALPRENRLVGQTAHPPVLRG